MDGHPWLFDNSLLVLHEFDAFTPTQKLKFDSKLIWVQIHNMPFACMNKECGEHIKRSLGRIVEMGLLVDGIGWGPYLRIKIDLSLRKPLARGRTICHVQGEKVWLPLKYERLPRVCFDCGCMVHGREGCLFKPTDNFGLFEHADQFGPWLRVETYVIKRSLARAGWNENQLGGVNEKGYMVEGRGSSNTVA
ncbi:uncharacterized protein At4g02000-like [Juglans regia]|uniref:Uncharacterized protein At4g02000-like n=1 Tax=Juglans regia TaxID=51240 RepID=A0A6P9E907_JUGRE|nr:uncharacterized protein At4g02000-like [Juglans regia]